MFIKIIKLITLTLIALHLSACVSITESRFTKKSDPQKAAATYVALGVSYLSQGNMILARKKIERALELAPDSAAAHSAMAMYWLERGEEKLTEQEFAIALDLDKQHSPSNYHYGLYLMSYKKVPEACDHISIAALDVDYGARQRANENLGICWLANHHESRAINAFEKAWTLDANSTVSSMNLASIYLKRKRIRLANRWFARFEKILSDNKVHHTAASLSLGLNLAKAGGKKNAAASYAFKLKKRFPKSEEYKRYKRTK